MTDFDWIGTARRGGWVSAQQAMELRARIAELEARLEETDQRAEWHNKRAHEALMRLAAVIALCDSLDGNAWRPATGRTVGQEVRAAATGDTP